MTLTEQWRKGELPEGFYYIADGAEVTIDYYLCDYWERHFDSDVQQVLAPVPRYEELEELKIDNHNLKAWIKHFQPKYKKMEKENQQLKALLKKLHRDAQEIVLYSHDIADIDQEDWFTISRRQADVANNIAKDIYNAIGEKK